MKQLQNLSLVHIYSKAPPPHCVFDSKPRPLITYTPHQPITGRHCDDVRSLYSLVEWKERIRCFYPDWTLTQGLTIVLFELFLFITFKNRGMVKCGFKWLVTWFTLFASVRSVKLWSDTLDYLLLNVQYEGTTLNIKCVYFLNPTILDVVFRQ